MPLDTHARLDELQARYGLPPAASTVFARRLELVAAEPASITAIREPAEGVDAHIADSLAALELAVVRRSGHIADLGSGAGFPGLALAIALPDAQVSLVESVGRKTTFLARVVEKLGLVNADVVHARAEGWHEGLGRHDLVTARALAPLPVLLEYAAPLLAPGGTLVAWKGRLETSERADGAAAASILGLTEPVAQRVQPFPDARDRYLYISSKVGRTPAGYPRRSGMACKRPLRVSS